MYLIATLKSDGRKMAIPVRSAKGAWIASLILARDAVCEIVDEPPLDLTVGQFTDPSFITLGSLQEEP